MTENSIAIPWRRKRRPPNKDEKKALRWFVWLLGVSVWGIVKFFDGDFHGLFYAAWWGFWTPVNVFFCCKEWKTVHNYIVNGYEDE